MPRKLHAAGLAIGIGMGGFVDGILFHQLLQFHNMLSARIPADTLIGAKINMVWDGAFHALVWMATAIGIWLLWEATKDLDESRSGQALSGSMLMGWGLFNVVEGVIDHHILNLHHVYQVAGQSVWDYAFLAWGAAMIVGGWLLRRAAARRPV
ncbi:DUF2243 domain-containing protein [Emcibacter sp. SYSU 3D8]|uniref:DUF2243 domain-containing protein n=1 Tax=Emcibacter sp. SYSU 3D8 TaxID=3133969 RepID=UPI0031FEFB77